VTSSWANTEMPKKEIFSLTAGKKVIPVQVVPAEDHDAEWKELEAFLPKEKLTLSEEELKGKTDLDILKATQTKAAALLTKQEEVLQHVIDDQLGAKKDDGEARLDVIDQMRAKDKKLSPSAIKTYFEFSALDRFNNTLLSAIIKAEAPKK
jgi:hypothetical protein